MAILPLSLVRGHLDAGRLLLPFPEVLRSPLSYWLICRRGEEGLPKIPRSRRWRGDGLADERTRIAAT